jgi:hypothetical protein
MRMAEYVPNPGWLRDFLRSDQLAEIIDGKGEDVEIAAKAIALEHVVTGRFDESIHRESGHYSTGRPYSRVSSDDEASLSIEFGTAHSQPVRALGRAIRSI